LTATPRARARSRRRRRHPRSPRAEVDKIESLDRYPFKIKLANDGAPTTKLRGCVTLTLKLCDPRTNEDIRAHPQKKVSDAARVSTDTSSRAWRGDRSSVVGVARLAIVARPRHAFACARHARVTMLRARRVASSLVARRSSRGAHARGIPPTPA